MKETVVIQFLLAAATSHITGDNFIDNTDDLGFGTGILDGTYGRTNGAVSQHCLQITYLQVIIITVMSFLINVSLQNR